MHTNLMGHNLAYRTEVFQMSVFIGSLILLKILFKTNSYFLNRYKKVHVIALRLLNSHKRLSNMSSSVWCVASWAQVKTSMILPQVLLKICIMEEFRYLLFLVYSLKLSMEYSIAFELIFQQLSIGTIGGKMMSACTYRCTCMFFQVLPDVSVTVLL